MNGNDNGVDRVFWGAVVLFLVVTAGLFLWKRNAVHQVEERAEEERRELVERARGALESQAIDLLRTTALPLGWAVREQVLDENYGMLSDLFGEMVAEPDVRRIVYANVNDSILVSTDQRLEGQALSSAVPGAASAQDRVTVREREDGTYDVIVPVVGFAQKRGVVVITYDGTSIERRLTDDRTPARDAGPGDETP